MAYASLAEVKAEISGATIPATPANGQVGESDITRFIDEADAEINSKIGHRYTTPITGVESLKVVKQISISFVLFRYHQITEITEDLPDASEGRFPFRQSNIGQRYGHALKQLTAIAKWTESLVDAVEVSGGGIQASPDPDDYTPFGDMGKTQW